VQSHALVLGEHRVVELVREEGNAQHGNARARGLAQAVLAAVGDEHSELGMSWKNLKKNIPLSRKSLPVQAIFLSYE